MDTGPAAGWTDHAAGWIEVMDDLMMDLMWTWTEDEAVPCKRMLTAGAETGVTTAMNFEVLERVFLETLLLAFFQLHLPR